MGPLTAALVYGGIGTGISAMLSGKKKGKIYIPAYSPEGKKLFGELHKSVLQGLFPENLASRFIGDAKKMEQARRRVSEKRFAGAGFRGPENVATGNVARGFLSETAGRLRNVQPGVRRAGQARREFAIRRLGNLQNIINLESNKPIALAQAGFMKEEQKQLAGAQRGAGLGSLAQLAALRLMM